MHGKYNSMSVYTGTLVDNVTITGNGVDIPLVATGTTAPSQNFTLTDNSPTENAISGMIFDFNTVQDIFITYSVHYSDSSGLFLDINGRNIFCTYNSNVGWRLQEGNINFDNILVDYFIDPTSGQVSYTTGNNAGSNTVNQFLITWKTEVLP